MHHNPTRKRAPCSKSWQAACLVACGEAQDSPLAHARGRSSRSPLISWMKAAYRPSSMRFPSTFSNRAGWPAGFSSVTTDVAPYSSTTVGWGTALVAGWASAAVRGLDGEVYHLAPAMPPQSPSTLPLVASQAGRRGACGSRHPAAQAEARRRRSRQPSRLRILTRHKRPALPNAAPRAGRQVCPGPIREPAGAPDTCHHDGRFRRGATCRHRVITGCIPSAPP